MNENIDLTKILKNCTEGWEFYSSTAGSVVFHKLDLANSYYPILALASGGRRKVCFTKKGEYVNNGDAECTFFPSKDQRDWSKFTAPWYKKEKFDPNTLQPFDRVLGRNVSTDKWGCTLFSNINVDAAHKFNCVGSYYKCCIPYNDETKHLVGTTDEAPEYYKYWEY